MNRQDAHDALLAWCSETGSGTIDSFRRSCRALELPVNRSARALSQLGHVEFDWQKGRYAAAPTTLTTIPGLPGLLLLTGSRPNNLIAEMAEIAAQSDLDVDVHRELQHQFGAGPSTAFVDVDPADGPEFCAEVGIDWSACASAEIAAVLPPLTVENATVRHRPDERHPHALLDMHTFRPRWDEGAGDGHEGMWFYRTWGRRYEMILRSSDAEPRLVLDPTYAPYLMDRAGEPGDIDPVVSYQRTHRLLTVNAAAPLPALHARCACLCSGRLPIRHDIAPGIAHEIYVNINPQTAELILRSLGAAT